MSASVTILLALAQGGPQFAPPQAILAGEAFAGTERLYPSPALHDVDGDGLQDLVIGDLFGKVTWAKRLPGAELSFAAEQPMKTATGAELKFNNW